MQPVVLDKGNHGRLKERLKEKWAAHKRIQLSDKEGVGQESALMCFQGV